jgi:hypothetical protein
LRGENRTRGRVPRDRAGCGALGQETLLDLGTDPGEGRREEDWPAVLRERLTSAAFGVGWVLVCRVPESWARVAFRVGADIAWRR